VRRPTFIGGWPLAIITALAIFLLAFAWMAWRVRLGQDPVLSNASAMTSGGQAKKIRRIIVERRVIVTELPPRQAATAPGLAASGTADSGGAQSYSAPQSTQNYTAPAPAPAPVSRGS
jgi:hypothetical protein